MTQEDHPSTPWFQAILQNIEKKLEKLADTPHRQEGGVQREIYVERWLPAPPAQAQQVDRPINLQVSVTIPPPQQPLLQLPHYQVVPFQAPFEAATGSLGHLGHLRMARQQVSPMAMFWNRALPYPQTNRQIQQRLLQGAARAHRQQRNPAPLAIDWREGLVPPEEATTAPQQQPLLLTWHPSVQQQKPDDESNQATSSTERITHREDTRTVRTRNATAPQAPPKAVKDNKGKRRRELDDLEDELPPAASQPLPEGPSQKLTNMASWPPEWVGEYNLFKACEDEGARRQRWDSWPPRLRTAVYNITGIKGRPLLKKWKQDDIAAEARMNAAEARASQATQPQQPTPPSSGANAIQPKNDEEESHSWMEGTRIGEATNPGPGSRSHEKTKQSTDRQEHQRHPSGNHAPGWSRKHSRAQARQHGARAAPQAPAGESAKGNRPGPKPTDDRSRSPPSGNGGRNRNPSTMRSYYKSRAETVQRTTGGSRGDQQQWSTVRSRTWEKLHKKIKDVTAQLQLLTEELHNMQATPAQPRASTPRHSDHRRTNQWDTLRRGAHKRHQQSIGFTPPSRRVPQESAGGRARQRPSPTRARSPTTSTSSARSATTATRQEPETGYQTTEEVEGSSSVCTEASAPLRPFQPTTTTVDGGRRKGRSDQPSPPLRGERASAAQPSQRGRRPLDGRTQSRQGGPQQAVNRGHHHQRHQTPPPTYQDALRLPEAPRQQRRQRAQQRQTRQTSARRQSSKHRRPR